MKHYILGILSILILGALYVSMNNKFNAMPQSQTLPHTPSSLKEEHEEIHNELAAAIGSGGKTAEAAEEVEKALKPHFEAEEQFAMPQLGLLAELSQGLVSAHKQAVIELSDKLKAELPAMLSEHVQIAAAAERLREVALSEHKPEAARFAEKLILHAKNEEEILYPSSILVGEYLKLL